MKTWIPFIGLIAGLALAAPAAATTTETSLSAVSRKDRAQSPLRRPAARRAEPQDMIACTVTGCQRIPRGCYPVTEYGWDGMPTGYDAVVCGQRK